MKTFVILIALAGGGLTAWLYLSALWLTVEKLSRQRRPGLWMTASLSVRLASLLIVFIGLARWGSWPALVAGLSGFVIVRTAMLRRLREPRLKTAASSS